jgi:uncharacterized membrane protein
MADPPGSARDLGLGTARVQALGDGIFAIALTLLVFEIKVPSPATVSAADLPGALAALWPKFAAFALSFVMLGISWIGHHNQFHFIRRSNRALLWLNLLFFLFVAFIPFSANLLGEYPESQLSVSVYCANLSAAGLSLYFHWVYGVGRGQLADPVDPAVARVVRLRVLFAPVAFTAAIGVSFASVKAALLVCLLVPLVYFVPGRIDRAFGGGDRG